MREERQVGITLSKAVCFGSQTSQGLVTERNDTMRGVSRYCYPLGDTQIGNMTFGKSAPTLLLPGTACSSLRICHSSPASEDMMEDGSGSEVVLDPPSPERCTLILSLFSLLPSVILLLSIPIPLIQLRTTTPPPFPLPTHDPNKRRRPVRTSSSVTEGRRKEADEYTPLTPLVVPPDKSFQFLWCYSSPPVVSARAFFPSCVKALHFFVISKKIPPSYFSLFPYLPYFHLLFSPSLPPPPFSLSFTHSLLLSLYTSCRTTVKKVVLTTLFATLLLFVAVV